MAKEVRIALSTPPEELQFLVQTLSWALESIPLQTAMELIYYLSDETDDAVVKAKIEPCIGAFVDKITISEFLAG